MDDKLFIAGEYNKNIDKYLAAPLSYEKVYQSRGLEKHLKKRQHINCLPYLYRVEEIISSPDYVGVNPNEDGTSFELIKCYGLNVLIGIKLDVKNDYLYVATMIDITEAKLNARISSGRLKKYIQDDTENGKKIPHNAQIIPCNGEKIP